jgi:methylated-DNA-protein-cysteine methyltransferase-like protein
MASKGQQAPAKKQQPAGTITGEPRIVSEGFHDRVYDVVRRVPAGSVTTYGDVAGALGSRRVARHVGYALAALGPDDADVPWHRVVNGQGAISFKGDLVRANRQRERLEVEGVAFDDKGRIAGLAAVRFVHAPPAMRDP